MKDTYSGFTLVELCVAILIFAIGITGIAAMQMEALKGGTYSNSRNDGVNIAKELVESEHADTGDDDTWIDWPEKSATGVQYQYQVDNTVDTVSGTIQAREITARVKWKTGLLDQDYELHSIGSPE